MKNRIVLACAGVALTTSLVCAPLSASASVPPSAQHTVLAAGSISGLSEGDWRDIPSRARAAGDADGASVADAMATYAADGGARTDQARNLWTAIAKKAVIQVLRYSTNKLPAKIRPYANKIINVVEDIDQFQQGAVVLALTKVGIPYDVAVATAQWIVLFVGL